MNPVFNLQFEFIHALWYIVKYAIEIVYMSCDKLFEIECRRRKMIEKEEVYERNEKKQRPNLMCIQAVVGIKIHGEADTEREWCCQWGKI